MSRRRNRRWLRKAGRAGNPLGNPPLVLVGQCHVNDLAADDDLPLIGDLELGHDAGPNRIVQPLPEHAGTRETNSPDITPEHVEQRHQAEEKDHDDLVGGRFGRNHVVRPRTDLVRDRLDGRNAEPQEDDPHNRDEHRDRDQKIEHSPKTARFRKLPLREVGQEDERDQIDERRNIDTEEIDSEVQLESPVECDDHEQRDRQMNESAQDERPYADVLHCRVSTLAPQGLLLHTHANSA